MPNRPHKTVKNKLRDSRLVLEAPVATEEGRSIAREREVDQVFGRTTAPGWSRPSQGPSQVPGVPHYDRRPSN